MIPPPRPQSVPIRMAHARFAWSAIIVAGGHGSRLGTVDKSSLRFQGESLLERAVTSTRLARHTVIVGVDDDRRVRGPALIAREEPRFAGPAFAVLAGLDRTDFRDDELVAVLACDVPGLPTILPLLLDRWANVMAMGGSIARTDGVIGVDAQSRRQPLLSLVRVDRLRQAAATRARASDWQNASMTMLFESLTLVPIPLTAGLARDVDTPEDARHFGIVLPERSLLTTGAR